MVTGSLDKTIKMWDMRQATPAKTFNCPEVTQSIFLYIKLKKRVYALDLMMPIMVAVTADKKLLGYRMDNDPSEWKVFESQLKQQLRCVSIFKNKNGTEPSGFAVGSIGKPSLFARTHPFFRRKSSYSQFPARQAS